MIECFELAPKAELEQFVKSVRHNIAKHCRLNNKAAGAKRSIIDHQKNQTDAVEKMNMVMAIANRFSICNIASVIRINTARTIITIHWIGAISAWLSRTLLRLAS